MSTRLAVVLLAVALLAAACSEPATEDMSDAQLRDAMEDQLEDIDLSRDQVDCILDELFLSASRADLNAIADAKSQSDFTAGQTVLLTAAVDACI